MSFFLVMKHTTRPSIDILGTTKDGRWRPLHTAPDELQTLPVRKQRHLVLPQHSRTLTLTLPRSFVVRHRQGILVVRIDESLYFGNVEQLASVILRIEKLGDRLHPTAQTKHQVPIYGVVIDARTISSLDAMYVPRFLSAA